MINRQNLIDKIFPLFPFLEKADNAVITELLSKAFISSIPRETIIFFEGDKCKQIALVLDGTVRIYKTGESGREITLYRIGKGESCVMTASCIFSHSSFPAIAVAEDNVEAIVIPSKVFAEWIDSYRIWRDFVFELLSRRMSEIISTVEEVAFRRMDLRIAELLINISNSANSEKSEIKITHQDIAMELGTSREVVSRILKNFECENLIALHRGSITVKNLEKVVSR